MIDLLAAVAALTLVYNCEVGGPKKIAIEGTSASASEIGLPEELKRWNFVIRIEQTKDTDKVAIEWPGDPMQANGETVALSIGKNAYAFATISGGPCLFTETACISQFTLADQPDGTAKLLITPAALMTDTAKDQRQPFLVVLEGRCSRSESRK